MLASSKPLFTECLHSIREGVGLFLRFWGLSKKGPDMSGMVAGPKDGRSLPWRRAQLQVKSRSHACITLAQGRARCRRAGGRPPCACQRGKLLCEPRGVDPQGWTNCWSCPPAHGAYSSTSPSSVSPPAPQCMLPPCPWRGQDIERRSAVYTFQNGQPCRVMGESDRVTRQARILPRVLKGDIP